MNTVPVNRASQMDFKVGKGGGGLGMGAMEHWKVLWVIMVG